ncbi:MAG: hypothetical protein DRQ08_01005 [Candidatus Latescibacterota bacterium]|nr:MAG: hypothetical protein DRQ08_01005 [Candidatus Latescibacterota bacterium]
MKKDLDLCQIGWKIRELVHSLNNKLEVIVGRTELALYTGKCNRDILEEILNASKDILVLIKSLGQLGRELSEQGG